MKNNLGTKISFVILFAVAIIFGFLRFSPQAIPNLPPTTTFNSPVVKTDIAPTTFTSHDGSLTFTYPGDWQLIETTSLNQNANFGNISETWSLSSKSVDTPFAMELVMANFANAEELTNLTNNCGQAGVTCHDSKFNNLTFKQIILPATNPTPVTIYFITTNNKLYLFSTLPGTASNQDTQQIKTLLETVKISGLN